MIHLLLKGMRYDDCTAQASTRPFIVSVKRENIPLTHPCAFFAEVCRMASRCRFAVSPAPVSAAIVRHLALWRRTRHPSGSRHMMDTSPCCQASGPWHISCPRKPSVPCRVQSCQAQCMWLSHRGPPRSWLAAEASQKLDKSLGGHLCGGETGSKQWGQFCTTPPSHP